MVLHFTVFVLRITLSLLHFKQYEQAKNWWLWFVQDLVCYFYSEPGTGSSRECKIKLLNLDLANQSLQKKFNLIINFSMFCVFHYRTCKRPKNRSKIQKTPKSSQNHFLTFYRFSPRTFGKTFLQYLTFW